MDKLKKLTRKEFFDTYGISLILKENKDPKTAQYLAFILEPIVKIYIDISYYAIRAELRYFKRGGDSSYDISDGNVTILKKLGIKNWRNERKKVSLADAKFLYGVGDWARGIYGGNAWFKICTAVENLEALLPVTEQNIRQVISAIDRLNDLEHNNAKYLWQYCTFDLPEALRNKSYGLLESELIAYCSKEIKDIYCQA